MVTRIGLIGAGGIGRTHGEILADEADADVVAVCDLDRDRADALAESLGAERYTDHRDLFEETSLDAVYVTTPPRTRVDIVEQAAREGIAIFSEKPLAATLEDGRAIRETVTEHDVPFMTGFCMRFRDPLIRLREFVREGGIGEPVHVFSTRTGWGVPEGDNWRTNPEQACGITVESASHDIDLLRWLGGEVTHARGETTNTHPELETFDDNVDASLRFASGALGGFQISWTADVAYNRRGVIGTEGTAIVEGDGMWRIDRLEYRPRDGDDAETVEYDPDTATDMGYRGETRAFLDAVQNGSEPPVGVAEGMRALEISYEILESATNSFVE